MTAGQRGLACGLTALSIGWILGGLLAMLVVPAVGLSPAATTQTMRGTGLVLMLGLAGAMVGVIRLRTDTNLLKGSNE